MLVIPMLVIRRVSARADTSRSSPALRLRCLLTFRDAGSFSNEIKPSDWRRCDLTRARPQLQLPGRPLVREGHHISHTHQSVQQHLRLTLLSATSLSRIAICDAAYPGERISNGRPSAEPADPRGIWKRGGRLSFCATKEWKRVSPIFYHLVILARMRSDGWLQN